MLISKKLLGFFCVFILLSLLAGFRPIGLDRDSLNYVGILHLRLSEANIFDKEPFYWIISEFNHFVFSGHSTTFFLLFALVGVFFKLLAIFNISKSPFFSIILYIFLYFILHEMTQIRVGVASGLFLLSIKEYWNKKYLNYFLITFTACLFHYTAVLGFLLLFLRRDRFDSFFCAAALFLSLIVGLFANAQVLQLFLVFLPDFLSVKLQLYIDLYQDGSHVDINRYNFYYLSLLMIAAFMLVYSKRVSDPFDLFLIKIFIVGLSSFYFFSFLPVMAFRISEFYLVVLIALLANFSFVFKPRALYILFIGFWSFLIFVSQGIVKNINFEVLL